MTLRRGARLLAALLVAGSAAAQHGETPEADVPDVPSGTARITGAIENSDAPKQVGGVELLLYALPPGGMPGLRRTFSDATGQFVFEGVSNDPAIAYLVGARYAGIPYPGDRISFAAGGNEKRVRVRVGETTADARGVAVLETQLEVALRGGRIAIAELVRFENRAARTAYVRAEERAGASPLYRALLPEGATDFQIPLGIQPEGLVREGNELRFYGPLYPSAWPGPLARDQGLAFHYTLAPVSGPVAIEKRLPSGAERVVVVAPADGPTLEIAGAREEAPPAAKAALGSSSARRLVLDHVPAGGRIEIRVDVPETRVAPDAVRVLESRIFLELDDAALQVQEEHLLEVSGALPVVAPEGGSLLELPVPAGAAEVRFDRDAFGRGLAADDTRSTVLRGPLPPGETRVQVAYHLPVAADGVALFEKRFGSRLPLLNVYVADTGLRLESERLHRRRPVRTTDRSYLALEAFEVVPSETVRLSLAPLGAPAQLPRAALLALLAIGAGLVFTFIARPLRPGRDAAAAPLEEVEDLARSEREAVYAALRDLEHDRETGKLSDEDYASMRRELRARAAALLRADMPSQQARTPTPTPTPARPTDPRAVACDGCGAPIGSSDRFCAQCGARVEIAGGTRA